MLGELPFFYETKLLKLVLLLPNNLKLFKHWTCLMWRFLTVCSVTFVHYDLTTFTFWKVNKLKLQIIFLAKYLLVTTALEYTLLIKT